jgi:dihydrofolate reductase
MSDERAGSDASGADASQQEAREMGEVVVFTNVTLDGVMQAPGRSDEDTRGGFTHGGWAAPYAAMQHAGGSMAGSAGLLLGRRTYEDFHSVWPKRKGSPFSTLLDGMQKYVASRTLRAPLPWVNSTLLKGDVGSAVARLRKESGQSLLVMGSGELARSLMAARLVDRYILLIHPLVLGSGRRLFSEGSAFHALRLVESRATPNGVVIATYEPAESPPGA